ncbi:hypothetical protein Tco_0839679 [Tanacetum coccineum]|uniref:Uncharacterized protein n=1 Tax=Tanacetum coccineum TaxID=301880 RepID=A0ABQ5AUG7_9ASTR
MSNLNFVETHNLVAFLEKLEESDGFEGIIDFLNSSSIRYALTVNLTIYTSCIKQFWATAKANTVNREVQIQALVDGLKVIVTETRVRRVLKLKNAKGTNCLPTATIFAKLERMGVKKLEKKKKSRPHGLRRLYKVGRSRRVESSEESLGDQGDASKQGRKITDLDAEVTLIDETQGKNDDNLMFDTGVLDGQEVMADKDVSTADLVTTTGEVVTTANVEVTTASATTTTADELTLAQTLIEIKAAKPKAVTTAATTVAPVSTRLMDKGIVKDNGKAKMVKEEPVKKFSKKEQIRLDQELAFKLQVEEEEEEVRLAKEKNEANVALTEEWDNVQAMIDADYQMAKQLQSKEQEQLTIEEKSKLFIQLLEARKKHFATLRAREKRNKPPTQSQQRKLYCNYLKNMEGYTLKQVKGFKFKVIKDMFDKAFKRVNTFVDYKTNLMEESSKKAEAEKENSSKRAGTELEQERIKKQKIDDDQEEAEMK